MDWSAIAAAAATVFLTFTLGWLDKRNERRHRENTQKFDTITKAQADQSNKLDGLSQRISFVEGALGIPIGHR
jgi:hypothetical protein